MENKQKNILTRTDLGFGRLPLWMVATIVFTPGLVILILGAIFITLIILK